MPIKQRLAVFARRMPGAAPQIFWHGTVSTLLRSIMLYGLDPGKVKIGNWREDRTVDAINPSKISYGGIYYAKSAYNSISYCNDLCRKFNSPDTAPAKAVHPLILAVQLQELSTLPDEDSYAIHNLFVRFIGQNEAKAAEILVRILTRKNLRWYGGRSNWRDYINQFRQQVMQSLQFDETAINKRGDLPRLMGAIDAMLLNLCRRYLAHMQSRASYSTGDYYIRKAIYDYAPKLAEKYAKKTKDGTTLVLPAKLKLPSAAQAERDAAKSIDFFIHITKNLGRHAQFKDNWRRENRTLRNLAPVGFRGRNRIVCVMELIDQTGWAQDAPIAEHIKVHYGKPPSEFLASYRKDYSSSKPIIWLNKSGQEIGRDDPKDKLRLEATLRAIIATKRGNRGTTRRFQADWQKEIR